jgi:DNA polymerase (family 10)
MPSNYTIAKALQRVSYYKQLCGEDPHNYAETSLMIQGLAGTRIDEVYKTTPLRLREMFPEGDEEYFQTLGEIIEDKEITVLKEGSVPTTLLDITDIKGLGAKTVRKMYTELGVTDLASLKERVDDGSLVKLKGFGPKLVDKINLHVAALEKKAKKG